MLRNIQEEFLKVHFDYCAFAVVDFKQHKVDSFSYKKTQREVVNVDHVFYDLASITKPLTLPVHYLSHPQIFDSKDLLLLNHRGGLPSGGRLNAATWKETLMAYKIYESTVLYSDYSALRLMLNLSPKLSKSFEEECAQYWADDVYFWKKLPANIECPVTGYRKGVEIKGVVHDDNAYIINEFCSHAGLFATIDGLSHTLLKLNKKFKLLDTLEEAKQKDKGKNRFVIGFDRVEDQQKTLAGKGASLSTFGHLGFTGTSFWIDLEKSMGIVLLTNGVRGHWYERDQLNHFRRFIGELLWK